MPYQIYVLLIIVLVIIGIMIFLSFVPIGLWITAFFSGVKIRLSTLIGMRLPLQNHIWGNVNPFFPPGYRYICILENLNRQ